jgi:hypothetical protein
MSTCRGSYSVPIRVNPKTLAGECPCCGRRFDWQDLAGWVHNIPLHSPAFQEELDATPQS